MRGVLGRVKTEFSRRARRARREEGGFTLAEVVIAVTILGVVAAAIAGAFIVMAHDSTGITQRFAASHDAQITSAYLATDVQSSTAIAAPTCSSGSGVIGFKYSSGAVASYCYGGGKLTRAYSGTPVTNLTLIKNGGGSPSATCVNPSGCAVGSTPTKVSIAFSENDGYSYTLAGSRRTSASNVAGSSTNYPPFLVLDNGSLSVSGNGKLVVNGQVIGSTGSTLSVGGNGTFSPQSTEHVGSCTGWPSCTVRAQGVPDPFAGLPVPDDAQNPARTVSGTTLQPGVYCQAVSLANGTFTLSSGLYIFEGGFSVSGPTTVNGSNVLLYVGRGQNSTCAQPMGGTSFSNKQAINLSPWNGGPYAGTNLVIWQANNLGLSISGQALPSAISGVIYAPTSTANLTSGNASLTIGAVIAKTVTISGSGSGSVVVGP
jgi:prepilin-type N-terminal cleavage/methylation domain-containing protein